MGVLSETASATPPNGGSVLRRTVLGGAAGVGEGTLVEEDAMSRGHLGDQFEMAGRRSRYSPAPPVQRFHGEAATGREPSKEVPWDRCYHLV